MSDTDSNKSPFDDSSEYDPDQDGGSEMGSHYVNERGDRYSEESSGYYFATKTDPSTTNKKHVRRINPETKKGVRVEFFTTNTSPNSIIRHAITGTLQGVDRQFFKAGSKDEDLFFSVILATGELGQTAPVLFYDNPEQYERHFFTKVPQQLKDRWNEKRNTAMFNLRLRQLREANGGVVLVK